MFEFELLFEGTVRFFYPNGCNFGERSLVLMDVDDEMRRFNALPGKIGILNFVFTESEAGRIHYKEQ